MKVWEGTRPRGAQGGKTGGRGARRLLSRLRRPYHEFDDWLDGSYRDCHTASDECFASTWRVVEEAYNSKHNQDETEQQYDVAQSADCLADGLSVLVAAHCL